MDSTERDAWDQGCSGPGLVWGAGPNRFVAAELAGLRPGRAVDLGTGEGRNAISLAERLAQPAIPPGPDRKPRRHAPASRKRRAGSGQALLTSCG